MKRRAAAAGARVPAAPVWSLLALALIAASPAWAQEAAPPVDTPAAAQPAPPVTLGERDAAGTAAAPGETAAASPDATQALPPADAAMPNAPATATNPPPADMPPVAPGQVPTADAPPAAADASTADAATPPPAGDDATARAESDFNALYGPGTADRPTAPAKAYDPWEPYNRRMHRFNNGVDRHVAKPLARAYVKVVPRPVRSGVSNFFSNLGQPLTAINSLLQGKPKQAAHSAGRFLLNSTVGIAGVFDPATRVGLMNANEDFGQTLGVWGWKRSRYVELPFFGPRTLRDVIGMAGDAPLSPLRQVEADRIRVPLQGLQLVDLRATLMSTDALREGAEDDYTLVRDAWMQRRAYQIDGDASQGDGTPDYLKDDPTVVPVNAMPVSGG